MKNSRWVFLREIGNWNVHINNFLTLNLKDSFFLTGLFHWNDLNWHAGSEFSYRFWYRVIGFMGTVEQVQVRMWYVFNIYSNAKILMIFRFIGNFSRYNSAQSMTYIANGKPFSITYGDGSGASGLFSIDNVTVSYKKTIQIEFKHF
jgi:hypothetical protein